MDNQLPGMTATPQKRRSGCLPGCLIGVLVVVLAGVGIGWWFLGKPVMAFTKAIRDITRIEELDTRVSNRASYDPPASGELTETQVASYLNVLKGIRSDMENRLETLAEKYEELGGEQPQLLDIPRFAEAYADVIGLLGEARESQVNALNAEQLSLGEYRWIRGQVLAASGLTGEAADFAGILGSLGGSSSTAGTPSATPNDANRELLRAYGEDLKEYGALTMLGF